MMAWREAFGRGSDSPSAPRTRRTYASSLPFSGAQLGHVHAALGQGARLVQADRVDPGEALDRGQLLDEALLSAEPDDTDREGDGGQEDEALGDHGDDAADGAGDRVLQVVVLDDQLGDEQADRGRDHHPGHVLEDRRDSGTEFRVDERETGGLFGELGRVRLAADLRGREGAAARDDETARHDRVAGLFDDGVGLAGEQRLVDLQPVGLERTRRPRRSCRRGRSR